MHRSDISYEAAGPKPRASSASCGLPVSAAALSGVSVPMASSVLMLLTLGPLGSYSAQEAPEGTAI